MWHYESLTAESALVLKFSIYHLTNNITDWNKNTKAQITHKSYHKERKKESSYLWVDRPRHGEDSRTGNVLKGVAQILRGADGGQMGLDGGVGMQALRVCHGWARQRVRLVDSGANRNDRNYSRCSHCCSYSCNTWRVQDSRVIQDTTDSLRWRSSCSTIGPTAARPLSLDPRAATHCLLVQPIPLVSHLKQDLRINTASLCSLLNCHASFLQHHIILTKDKYRKVFFMGSKQMIMIFLV